METSNKESNQLLTEQQLKAVNDALFGKEQSQEWW